MNFEIIYQNIFQPNTNNESSQIDISNQEIKNENLEKKIKAKRVKKDVELSKSAQELTYENYFKNQTLLSKYKLDELKYIAKKHKLKFSGTKKVLIERIGELFLKIKNAVKIQSIIRRWFVVFYIKNRGPALKDRSICTNDSDFVTLEPITEIPTNAFFSYKDSKGFTYGFDISSLIEILKNKYCIHNPYNRELFDLKTSKIIMQLYNISFLIYPELYKENSRLSNVIINQFLKHINSLQNGEQNNSARITATLLEYRNVWGINNQHRQTNETREEYNNITRYSEILTTIQLSPAQNQRLRRLNEIRDLTIAQRINNLFIEIDSLGNYTQANWFDNLNRNEYIALHRTLYDIWYFQGNLQRTLRHNICPFQTPFYNMNSFLRNSANMTLDQVKEHCLITFENLIYTGIDDEHRQLGAMHSLSALTLVSIGARISLPWLYESVAF